MYKKCEEILKELEKENKIKVWWDFKFPEPEPLELRLKDMLEDEVDEKYYLSQKQVDRIYTTTYNVGKTRIQEKDYSDTLCARDWKDPKCVRVGGIYNTETSKHQAGSIYDKDGLSPTIETMQGGNRQPMVEDTRNLKEQLCDYLVENDMVKENDVIRHSYSTDRMNNFHTNGENNISPTLDTRSDCLGVAVAQRGRENGQQLEISNREIANSITTVQKDSMVGIQKIDIPQIVRVRKYPVDIDRLVQVLRNAKIESDVTNKQIAEQLDIPVTQVEHYFRTDNSFAIPEPSIWLKLKEILHITTNDFDESIMTFEEREGVYEKANRCYLDNGIAPTLNTSDDVKVIPQLINKDKRLQKLVENTEFKQGEVMNLDIYNQRTNKEISQTLTEPHHNSQRLFDGLRIRKLTPKECWRLMRF